MRKEITNVFGKVFLVLEYNPANRYYFNQWQGYQTLENIMTGANTYLQELAHTACPYLLNDNTGVTGPWHHAVTWIAEDWTPRAMAAGLKYFAHVVSPESLAALSAEAMVSRISNRFEMRIFGSIAEARQWLGQMQRADLVLTGR